MNYYKKYILSSALCLMSGWLTAQDKVQVVVKTIHKELDFKAGDQLQMFGEKAHIQISDWNKNKIGLEIKLIAKHPDREVALAEVDYNAYRIRKEEGKYIISNFFNLTEKYTDVRSNLSVQFIVHIPKGCPVIDIKSKYGSVIMENVSSTIKITSDLSPVTLKDVEGNVSINTRYGDVIVENERGNIAIVAEKSNVSINQLEGTCAITNQYGKIDVVTGDLMKDITINSKFSGVTILVKAFEQYSYDVENGKSDIYVPDKFKNAIKGTSRLRTFHHKTESSATVTVRSFFMPVRINEIN